MSYELTAEDYAAAELVAKQFARRYRGYVDEQDVCQECLMWFLTHPNKAAEFTDKENKYGERLLYRSLRNAALDYCRREKAVKLGYDVSDEYYYSIGMVEKLLPAYFDPSWAASGIDLSMHSGASNKPVPAEGGNLKAMITDVGAGYSQMGLRDQALLFRIYGEPGLVADAVAVEAAANEVTVNAQRKRIRRVVGRLRKQLGGPSPWQEEDDE